MPKMILILIVVFVGVSCRQEAATPEPSVVRISADLQGTEWTLWALRGRPLIEGTEITLKFTEERIEGGSRCGYYFASGPIRVEGGEFSITEIARTTGGCTAGVQEQANAYHRALVEAVAYEVTDEQLELYDGGGEAILVFVPAATPEQTPAAEAPRAPSGAALEGTEWTLLELRGRSLLGGTEITLKIGDGRIEGESGCNSYFGEDAVMENGRFSINEVGRTLADCSAEVMEQEQAFHTALGEAVSYQAVDGRLTFYDSDGRAALVFGPVSAPLP